MCGRTSLVAPAEKVAERFGAEPVEPLEPRYNVSPGQSHPVVRNDAPEEIRFPAWGLVPQWTEDGSGHINARAETLAEKPSFREAFAERRCLVLVDGFYDWKPTPTGKQPYRIEFEDRTPFACAGLWEPSESGATFTIVTTEPNEVVEPVHHRMPVILSPEEERPWLRADDTETAKSLLDPYPPAEMHTYPVSTAVNDPTNDSPELLEAVPAEEDVQTGLGDFH